MLQDITNARDTEGKQVVVAAFDTLPGNLPSSLDTLAPDHAYVVTEYQHDPGTGAITKVRLYNPWGHDHVWLEYEYLSEVLDTVFALDRLDP